MRLLQAWGDENLILMAALVVREHRSKQSAHLTFSHHFEVTEPPKPQYMSTGWHRSVSATSVNLPSFGEPIGGISLVKPSGRYVNHWMHHTSGWAHRPFCFPSDPELRELLSCDAECTVCSITLRNISQDNYLCMISFANMPITDTASCTQMKSHRGRAHPLWEPLKEKNLHLPVDVGLIPQPHIW